MKNYYLLIVFLAVLASFSSCTKRVSRQTTTELLTSNVWIYKEYYRNTNTTPVLYYKRDNTNNYIDLSINKVYFNKDGSYLERNEQSLFLKGTWELAGNETQTVVINPYGIFTARILKLTNKEFIWEDITTSNGTKGIMVPQ